MKLYLVLKVPKQVVRAEKDIKICWLDDNVAITSEAQMAKDKATELNSRYGKLFDYQAYRLQVVK